MGDRLDFEFDDPLMDAPPPPTKRRKKVIGLDDLLADYYKEKGKCIERESKKKKVRRHQYSDDEDDNIKETRLSKTLDQCHKQIKEIGGDDISRWGLRVFQDQKTPPALDFPELNSCSLLHSFDSSILNSLVSFSQEEGGNFLEGMLVNGWLSKLITERRHVEKVIATWTFNLMMFSASEHLSRAACDFWCDILLLIHEEIGQPIKVDWVPYFSELKIALDVYGFTINFSSDPEHSNAGNNPDSNCTELSQNIRMWIKFVTASCQARDQQPIFLASEAEELTELITYMFLDHQLDGLSIALCKCMLSAISYFSDEEWEVSCTKIAKSIARWVPKDINCLRAVECIRGGDIRSQLLRSELPRQILSSCLDTTEQVSNEEEILNKLISINVKEKSCDLFKVYIYLILTQNWVSRNPKLEGKPVIHEMWGVYLRNCSCLIASTDLRPYASKVRNRASFILQGSVNK